MKIFVLHIVLACSAAAVNAQVMPVDSTRMKTPGTNWTETVTYVQPDGQQPVYDMTYYNGLGYPSQVIQVRASSAGTNLVTPIVYDNMRRGDSRAYLPFASNTVTCRMEQGPLDKLRDYYRRSRSEETDSGTYVYAEKQYETSPLGRVSATVRPGKAYRTAGEKAARYGYDVCSDGEVLHLNFTTYSSSDGLVSLLRGMGPWLEVEGYYPKGALTKNTVTDEDGITTHVFTDGTGRTLLVRVENSEGNADTYYVYDFAGRLGWVLTPEGAARLEIGTTYRGDSDLARDYSYYYQYDAYGRLTVKHLPGRFNNEFFVYDDCGRLVKHCDGNYSYFRIGEQAYLPETAFGVNKIPMLQQEYYTHRWDEYEYDAHNRIVRQWRFTASNEPDDVDIHGNVVFFRRDSVLSAEYRYDGYSEVPATLCFVAQDSVVDYSRNVAGRKVYEKLLELSDGSPRYAERCYYYDDYGRSVEVVERRACGSVLRTSYVYDFQNNIVRESESVLPSGRLTADVKLTLRRYDSRNRLLREETSLNGCVPVVEAYAYDDFGRISQMRSGTDLTDAPHVTDFGELSVSYDYTLQGWLRSRTDGHYSEQLHYATDGCDGRGRYTGSLSGVSWDYGDGSDRQRYEFTYDSHGRLTGSDHYENDTLLQRYSEGGIRYDLNGNILSLERTQDGRRTSSAYFYRGGRVHRVVDFFARGLSVDTPEDIYLPEDSVSLPGLPEGPVFVLGSNPGRGFYPYPVVSSWSRQAPNSARLTGGGDSCRYDINGNLTYDPRQGLTLSYNAQNRLSKVRRGVATVADYSYLWDGTKILTVNGMGEGLAYFGSLVYRKSGAGLCLESAGFSGGRIVSTTQGFVPVYYLRDHLGSVRVVLNRDLEVVERNDYYPFGLRWGASSSPVTDNRYRYNGKEEQFFAGVPYIDYGARQYDPLLCRWLTQDELLEKYYGLNPYVFCGNNPINRIDSDGRTWVDANNYPKYQNGKWTKYANAYDRQIGQELQKTKTGKKMFNHLVNADVLIQVNLGKLDAQKSGNTKNQFASTRLTSSKITLDINNIKVKAKDEGISVMQALASTFGHEIKHTTEENVQMQIKSLQMDIQPEYADLEEEKDAKATGDQIIYEYKNNIKSDSNEKNVFSSIWDFVLGLLQ